MASPVIHHFYHRSTNTFTYVVACPETKHCAIIDSALDFAYNAGRIGTDYADRIIDYVRREGLTVAWLLETHAHADHLSAAAYLQSKLGGKIGIGEHIREVQQFFKSLYNIEDVSGDGSEFDRLFADGETFQIGNVPVRTMHTPGHTPACLTYVVNEEAAFVGDTVFMPDYGTARCDFPNGSSQAMYRSIREKILTLPGETKLYMCHDYRPGAPGERHVSTVKEQRERNPLVHDGTSEDQFVKIRDGIDQVLAAPKFILPSLQVNIRAGRMPPPETNDKRYLKIPLNVLGSGNLPLDF
ncbi:MAG: MBL fold metallo-hydrolase [Methylohalobius sp. ZOD2]